MCTRTQKQCELAYTCTCIALSNHSRNALETKRQYMYMLKTKLYALAPSAQVREQCRPDRRRSQLKSKDTSILLILPVGLMLCITFSQHEVQPYTRSHQISPVCNLLFLRASMFRLLLNCLWQEQAYMFGQSNEVVKRRYLPVRSLSLRALPIP